MSNQLVHARKNVRYSFRMPDGKQPRENGQLCWSYGLDEVLETAKNWGASHILVLEPSKEVPGDWTVLEEIRIGNF